jgi:hypothetical protein
MVIIIYAITYSVKMTRQTSLGLQCVEVCRLNYLAAGLVYLPSGVAGGIGSFSTGKQSFMHVGADDQTLTSVHRSISR